MEGRRVACFGLGVKAALQVNTHMSTPEAERMSQGFLRFMNDLRLLRTCQEPELSPSRMSCRGTVIFGFEQVQNQCLQQVALTDFAALKLAVCLYFGSTCKCHSAFMGGPILAACCSHKPNCLHKLLSHCVTIWAFTRFQSSRPLRLLPSLELPSLMDKEAPGSRST